MPQRYRKITVNGKTRQLSRHLMEQHLGRKLARNELVHHKNENKLDDRIENYEIKTPKAHAQLHNQKHPLTRACVICENDFTPHPTKRASKKTCSADCFARRRSEAAKAQMARGEAPRAKLSKAQVEEIRRRYAAGGVSQRALAAEYGVTHGVIGGIARGESWRAA